MCGFLYHKPSPSKSRQADFQPTKTCTLSSTKRSWSKLRVCQDKCKCLSSLKNPEYIGLLCHFQAQIKRSIWLFVHYYSLPSTKKTNLSYLNDFQNTAFPGPAFIRCIVKQNWSVQEKEPLSQTKKYLLFTLLKETGKNNFKIWMGWGMGIIQTVTECQHAAYGIFVIR